MKLADAYKGGGGATCPHCGGPMKPTPLPAGPPYGAGKTPRRPTPLPIPISTRLPANGKTPVRPTPLPGPRRY